MSKEITLVLTTEKVDIILQALAELPWKMSNNLIIEIRNQGLPQITKEVKEEEKEVK